MQKLILLVLFIVSLSVKSQIDTAALNKLSPEQLLQYYINEKEPEGMYKGPPKVGDSLYNELNPLVIPTQTVYADGLYHQGIDISGNGGRINLLDTINRVQQQLKPKIAIGAGRLGYFGNLYTKKFQSPLTARYAFDLNISQRLTRYLQLNFNVMFGKLGANENTNTRHLNFQSEIRAGGLNLLYDFGNFIPDRYRVRPFVSLGITGFEFLSKTDLKDKNGNTYYYWSDGSIKDKDENAADAQFAKDLKRDYTYETDVRINNQKINGKYDERSWAIPIGAGAIMQVTDRVDFKLNFQLFFTNTKYIDPVTSENTIGKLNKNKFTYTSVSLQYDLIANNRQKQKLQKDTLSDAFWLAFDKTDSDKDGVPDLQDDCQGTEEGAKVDAKGCPLDDDKDGIPNYRDDELATPLGVPVNERGVGQTDEYWAAWYNQYMNDTTGVNKTIEIVGNIYDLASKKIKLSNEKDIYTVELIRYSGSIPTDELAFLLSIGDIKSTTLQDGTTVVYTSGDYKKVSTAVKRRDEFRAEGNKNASISKIKGKNIVQLSDGELEELLKKEKEDELKLASNTTDTNSANTSTNSGTNNVTNNSTEEVTEKFSKDQVVYRVQLGAFKNKISTNVFNTSAGVLELKTGESIFRYVTKGFKTIDEAAAMRADLVVQGYSDAFVTAYKDGKRIPLNQTKATVDKKYKEDLNEEKMFSSVDKKLVVFRVQLSTVKPSLEKINDEKYKDIKDIEKQLTALGTIRYVAGSFSSYKDVQKYKTELQEKGFTEAFEVATFKGKIISTQEALELLQSK